MDSKLQNHRIVVQNDRSVTQSQRMAVQNARMMTQSQRKVVHRGVITVHTNLLVMHRWLIAIHTDFSVAQSILPVGQRGFKDSLDILAKQNFAKHAITPCLLLFPPEVEWRWTIYQ